MSKIIKLKSENFKKIQVVDLYPDENINIISGKNGAGKSSILDSIAFGIGGKKSVEKLTEPIRKGEKKAEVTIELNDYNIKRVVTGSGERLEVTAKDGKKLNSPQALLDSLYGSISFDPLKFASMDAKEQIKTLFNSVSTDVKWDDLETKKKELFEERTVTNREVKRLETAIFNLPTLTSDDFKMQKPDAADLISRISASQEQNMVIQDLQKNYEAAIEKFKQIKAQIDDLTKQLEVVKNEGISLKNTLSVVKQPEDIEPLKKQLAEIEKSQIKYQKVQEKKSYSTQLIEAQKKADELTENINKIEFTKIYTLENANLPVKGLSFTEEGITYNGIPFAQACSSDKLRISTVISCLLNKGLKVILIRDGSLLDSENMAMLKRIAEYYDNQIWIEKVDETGKVGIVIEEGKVKEVN